MERKIIFYGKYFFRFYEKQDVKTKRKIDFVIDIIRNVERVPIKFLKFLEGTYGIYEIRVLISLKSIGIFCFFDEGQLVILINCYIKKTRKIPKKELELAKKLKQQYYEGKRL
ncbi:type II toxin-antitoxin system RelE/ParE family toxin [bacterium]|nr:type II toxin-antitoxin system RelE/ParE family toxin [bacterium]